MRVDTRFIIRAYVLVLNVLYSFLRASDLRFIRTFEHETRLIRDRKSLIEHTLKSTKRAFDVDFVGWNEMDPNRAIYLDVQVYPQFPKGVEADLQDPMIYYTPRHPSLNFFYSKPREWMSTNALTDILPIQEFKASALYHETYKMFEANHLLFLHFPGTFPSRVFLTLTRKSVTYSYREKALLNCMGFSITDHLKRLDSPVTQLTYMKILNHSLTGNPATLLKLNSRLEPLDQNPWLKPIFKIFFADEPIIHGIPKSLRQWLDTTLTDQKSGIQQIGVSFQRSTVFRRWDRNLIVIWIKQPGETHSILSLQEDASAKHQYESIISQLTRRQRQVFHLLKDGKTSIDEIAAELNISKRTAEGHKQHLLQILKDF